MKNLFCFLVALWISPAVHAAAPRERSKAAPSTGKMIRSTPHSGLKSKTGNAVADYNIVTAGGNLVLTDLMNAGETISMSENGTNLRLDVTGKTYSLNGVGVNAFPFDIALSSLNSITVNAEGGDDIIDVGGFTIDPPSITLNGGTGNDRVHMNDDIVFQINHHLNIDLQNDDMNPGADEITFTGDIGVYGTGTATVRVSKSVVFNSGSSLYSTDGNLIVEANQQASSASGYFTGIQLLNATIGAAGIGQVTVKGKGGSTGGQGIQMFLGSTIFGGSSGTLNVEGKGGTGSGSNNHGIYIDGANSKVYTFGAHINVNGIGGSSVSDNSGVYVENGGQITADGTGSVTVTGQGGTGGFSNGVYVSGNNSLIKSNGGDVNVTGTGGTGGTGAGVNLGVRMHVNSQISAGGMGSVTVTGTGGAASGDHNYGIMVATNAVIFSSGGNLQITGNGGGTGTSSENKGIYLTGAGQIHAGNMGTVTVVGKGGLNSYSYGVMVEQSNSFITSDGGNVSVTGTGGNGAARVSAGVWVVSSGLISAGGTGNVTITGTGGIGPDNFNYGVIVSAGNAAITSSGGNIQVNGTGGGSGASSQNYGVFVTSTGQISAGNTGTVTVVGQGGNSSGGENTGVYVEQTNSMITSNDGNVSVTGTGGGTGTANFNYGIWVSGQGKITAGGTGTVTVAGTGGSATGTNNHGIHLSGGDITSSGGSVSVNGIAGNSTSAGINVQGKITTLANGGNISVKTDKINLLSSGIETQNAGHVLLLPNTNTRSINLGSEDANSLSLTDTELDLITTGTLEIGDAASGAITVSAAISRPASTHLQLTSGGAIQLNASSLNANGGDVQLNGAGGIQPTATGTDLSGGTHTFGSGNDLQMVINGTTPDAQYRQLNAVGTVNLTGLDLVMTTTNAFVPSVGQSFVIVNNDGSDAIIGTFNGLPSGTFIPNLLGSSFSGYIVYNGGDGNDVEIAVVPSNNANLSNLTVNPGTLSPGFDAGTTAYAVSVPNATAGITVTPAAADPNATLQLQVNGNGYTNIANNTPTGLLPLNPGTNTIQVKVISPASTNKVYTLTVTRACISRLYVKSTATGLNDGSTWVNAFTQLQDALDAACVGTEIWVAAGTYKPTRILNGVSVNPRDKAFIVERAVNLYGGFVGTETLLSERDPSLNSTVLSGDFNGDDVVTGSGSSLTINNNGENAFHVVAVKHTVGEAVVDGVVIKGGNADGSEINGSFLRYYGGGLSYVPISPTSSLRLNTVLFTGNNALHGGGASNFGSNLQITNSRFFYNSANIGGGLDNRFNAELSGCVFKGNRASYKGGGMSVDSGGLRLFRQVLFMKNHAGKGGGLAVEGGYSAANTLMNELVFTHNTAANEGGAFYAMNCEFKVTNAVFAYNIATRGGAVANSNVAQLTFQNAVFWKNVATGGSALFENTANEYAPWSTMPFYTPIVSYSDVEGSDGSGAGWNTTLYGTDGGNNRDIDPLFKDSNDEDGADDRLLTADDGFSLSPCSPLINVGTNTAIISTDIAGNPRPYNGGIADIGAYEFPSDGSSGNGTINGGTSVCVNSTLALTYSGPAGGTWSSSNPLIATVNPATGEVTGVSAGQVQILYANAPSCPNGSDQITLTVKPLPTSNLTASQMDVCPNTQVTLDAHCSVPTATVHWNPGAPTVTPDAPNIGYVYKATCAADGCTGNESSVEIRTHRILADLKDIGLGLQPKALAGSIKDNLSPANTITAPASPRLWTIIATGCSASEAAVFKLSGPVSFSSIDNEMPYALFSNEAGRFYSIDHPNYGTGGSFPNGTYTLTLELRSADGVGGPFPKNRVATGALLATRTLQFTVNSPVSGRQAAVNSELLAEEAIGGVEIWPNPASNILRLNVNEAKDQSIYVNLSDASGRIMMQRTFVPTAHRHQEEFEVSHFSNGLYFLRVHIEQKHTTLKWIKTE
ncbi:MAG: cadherin-like beta sandwich domain-containing protein [Spirosomataceae bacterium]